ncbi:hypothetical protein [Yanghanlia caeni]|uniref:Inner membrane protein n=1 Tax=Yanghanlia caeni TaxID=3064283 RepID=A0ABU1D4D7_9BURK|nr:hypothetical protein [Alcaligenaceae bacterium LG-2]NGR09252.1 hypothetical protein [bacterium SGD-2]HZH55856.1 hypothetical protein [Burkholderiaceae bacterium]
MFGSSKRNAFRPTAYGPSRRRGIPRWLVLMLTGIVLGAGGLLFLQKSYGPTRLTVEQSEQLHYDLNSANIDKQRLQAQLNQHAKDLKAAHARIEEQEAELQRRQAEIDRLATDVALFVETAPDDPRGTSPGIRAVSFNFENGKLDYHILVMQDAEKAKPFSGEVSLIAAGRYSNGRNGNVELEPFPISLERYTHMQGTLEVPEGFTPREVTIQIRADGSERVSAMRVIRVPR